MPQQVAKLIAPVADILDAPGHKIGFGQTPARFLADLATPPGLLGLAGQAGFGLIPLLRQPKG